MRPIGPHNSLDLTCAGVARAVKIEVAREDLREAITYQKSTTSRPVSAAPRTSIDQSPASRPKRRSAAVLARITGVLSARFEGKRANGKLERPGEHVCIN